MAARMEVRPEDDATCEGSGDGPHGSARRTGKRDEHGGSDFVSAIEAGAGYSCAIVGGAVRCWGAAPFGRDGTSPNDRSRRGERSHRRRDGHLLRRGSRVRRHLWRRRQVLGIQPDGQLGDGTQVNRMAPVDVMGLDGPVVSVAAGTYHTCALTAGGGVGLGISALGLEQPGERGDGHRGGGNFCVRAHVGRGCQMLGQQLLRGSWVTARRRTRRPPST